jgi:hypothetical protein
MTSTPITTLVRRATLLALAAPFAVSVLPAVAVAGETTPSLTKAQIEHAEVVARLAGTTKAQVEHAERVRLSQDSAAPTTVPAPSRPAAAPGDATNWQLALSAALGAAVAGTGVVAARRLGQHAAAVAH